MSGSTVNPLKYNAESEGNLWVAVSIPVLVLTYITGALRLWWRYRVSGRISASDWCVIISLLCITIQEILGLIAILKWGLGHHTAYLGTHRAQKAMLYFYTYQVFYKTMVGTTKMSFVFLYLELFPIKWFIWVCHGVNISIVAAIIAFDAGTIFQCTPIPYFWNRSIPGGYCVETAAFWYGHAGWNSAADIMILLLPIPVIRSLQMGRAQKMAVMGVFGLGAFVIVASVMRMIALNPASKTEAKDMTYVISSSNAFLWTQVEASVAIICTCLPTLKGPLMRIAPNLFSSKDKSTQDAYNLNSLSKKGSDWKNTVYSRNQHRRGLDPQADDASSQERIFGITKTIGVEVSSTLVEDEELHGKKTTAGEEDFRNR